MTQRTVKLTGTTDTSGALVVTTERAVRGRIVSVRYVKSDFADGSTMTLSLETTGTVVWQQTGVNASVTVYPRAQVHSGTGVGLTYDGTQPVCEPVPVAGERLVMTVANGGNTKTGTWYVTLE